MIPHSLPRTRPLGGIVESVLRQISEFGHDVKPSSRLAMGSAAISRSISAGGSVAMTAEEHAALAAACRDFVSFDFILNAPAALRRDPEFAEKLKTAMRDGVHPGQHGRMTAGRDTQLELFVAAALARAAMPVKLGTPDIRTRVNGGYLFLEVKRPRTMPGIVEAVKTATKQIRSSGYIGSIYIDVSLAMNPNDGVIEKVLDDVDFYNFLAARLRQAIGPHIDEIQRILWRQPVTGLLIQWDVIRTRGQGTWMLDGQLSQFTNHTRTPRMAHTGDLLYRSLPHGLPVSLQLFPVISEASPREPTLQHPSDSE